MLTEKLHEVISEGILDSILPFICAANLSIQNDKLSVSHTCGLKTKSVHTTKVLSPRIVVNTEKDETNNANRSINDSTTNVTTSSKDRQQRRKSSQSMGLLSEYA